MGNASCRLTCVLAASRARVECLTEVLKQTIFPFNLLGEDITEHTHTKKTDQNPKCQGIPLSKNVSSSQSFLVARRTSVK